MVVSPSASYVFRQKEGNYTITVIATTSETRPAQPGLMVASCVVAGRSRVRDRAVAGLSSALAALPDCYRPLWE